MHGEDERTPVGMLIVYEVRKAIDMDYRVLHVYEFYEYAVTQYDSKTGQGGLSVEYINTFLKLKVEASGYPNHAASEQDNYHYITKFYTSDGILLDRANIVKNSAKRVLDKLCLNSFWGKPTEINNRPKSQIITDPQGLYRLLSTPGIDVTNILCASDKVVWASRRYYHEEHVDTTPYPRGDWSVRDDRCPVKALLLPRKVGY